MDRSHWECSELELELSELVHFVRGRSWTRSRRTPDSELELDLGRFPGVGAGEV